MFAKKIAKKGFEDVTDWPKFCERVEIQSLGLLTFLKLFKEN